MHADLPRRHTLPTHPVNHQISKTLVQQYGSGTLFVLEDLTGVSFSEENLKHFGKSGRHQLRSWAFYQLEQMLAYKAHEKSSEAIKIKLDYTSQRCPKCGRIRKENRDYKIHEYVCDCGGYRSNDDRIGGHEYPVPRHPVDVWRRKSEIWHAQRKITCFCRACPGGIKKRVTSSTWRCTCSPMCLGSMQKHSLGAPARPRFLSRNRPVRRHQDQMSELQAPQH